MGFRRVAVYGYRNLQDAAVDTGAEEIFLVGENGQGKTNFLEAVYFLSFGSSFRSAADFLVPRDDGKEFSVRGIFQDSEREIDIALKYQGRKKEIRLDGKQIRDRKELVSNVPCIVFTHGDIDFVAGRPERRRWFINQIMSLFNPLFIDLLRSYNRLIKQKNQVLKEGPASLLDSYDLQIARAGLEIQRRRRETIQDFNRTFSRLFGEISRFSGELTIEYRPSWKAAEDEEHVVRLLASQRGRDLDQGMCTSGPHRDRIRFVHQGNDYVQTASTGQLRLISLVLRVAQSIFFSEKTRKKPVLLLDDVLLELDLERRKRFLASLPAYEQAFFTFLPDEPYREYRKPGTLILQVKSGILTPV
ncbi:DNA replication and repair protein RecF [Marispirochaeta aestuarii]|uniref:DNA replication and repair protein RecF n=1 Tax=Marispirochaeta aestuarii TaxID=1963862 RepID=A0A1Y1RXR7_9SPIO|nr:DNA replication and repair protein RecF [Marispirochaeta aestuarii]ORC34610.1 DNA replication and repair protein RecF [Marispirochaeta aestuarii]